ncbi:MAG TPA: hypothetical protein VHN82_02335, partial [Methanoregula sp.]|nr:hypothetical protein [Methanoregula sp.]
SVLPLLYQRDLLNGRDTRPCPDSPGRNVIVIAMAAFFSFRINDTGKYLMLKKTVKERSGNPRST